MKRIIVLFTLFLTVAAYAQVSGQTRVINKSKPLNAKNDQSSQVGEINQRFDVLIRDIASMYQAYDAMKDKWFQSKKGIEAKMNEVKGQQDKEDDKKNKAEERIKTINKELEWISELRAYYENGSIDALYRGDDLHPHADLLTLSLHKQLLGANYPKKIDDLMLLAECANSLQNEYNETRNNEYRNRLAKMTECDTKWDIDGLLAIHGDMKEEVDKREIHSLMKLMEFRKYLMNEYGADLDTEFPFLANQVREKMGLKQK